MDKTILRKFAIESRQDLMQKIESKIKLFYVDETFSKQQNGDVYVLANEKHILSLSKEEYEKRELLIKRINELGVEQVIEEAAYTWFNRIVAIRYMEINDYLPLTKNNQSLGIRVLSSKDNTPDPEIMKFTNLTNSELDIDFRKEKYADLKEDKEKFQYILLLICKKIGKVIPQVFDGVTDYIDLLIPDNLLNDTGFITKLINEVPVDNFKEVEIIGWLYQYYIAEKKDIIFKKLKNSGKVLKTEVAAATQLFTPEWIVKYLVENSVINYLKENSNINISCENFKYLINNSDYKQNIAKNIESIKFLDPCCGSGHILVYALCVFYEIYKNLGYSSYDSLEKILTKNLYGLDIDDRAVQLTILALLLKAREYNKNIFNTSIIDNLNVHSYKESNGIEILDFANNTYYIDLLNNYKDGKQKGLLIKPINVDEEFYNEIKRDDTIFGIEKRDNLVPILKINELLNNKYSIIVTNPPYMGANNMNKELFEFLKKEYSDSKQDLYSACMEKIVDLCEDDGYISMITMESWMSLSKFLKFRKKLLNKVNIESLVHMPYDGVGKTSLGISFGTSAFVFKKTNIYKNGQFMCIRYNEIDEDGIPYNFPTINERYLTNNTKSFTLTDDYSISYWISEKMRELLSEGKKLNEYGDPKQGLATSDNERFLRLWFEVNKDNICFDASDKDKALLSHKKWFPITKGGVYKKWFGNNYYVVNWENDGKEMKDAVLAKYDYLDSPDFVVKNQNFYFKKGITWSTMTSGSPSFRYTPNGFIFETKGSIYIPFNPNDNLYFLGFLNSKVANKFLEVLCPTKDIHEGPVGKIPAIYTNSNDIDELVKQCIDLCEKDWNENELSWNFNISPLLKYNASDLANAVTEYKKDKQSDILKLKDLEKEINQFFINLYDMNDISAAVEDDSLTIIQKSDKQIVIEFIHYLIGCIFGRYQNNEIEKNGLIDDDNIIPICEEQIFKDDLYIIIKKSIEILFKNSSIEENINFIAETLGKKGTETNEERIRKYLVNEFYSDHCKMFSVVGSGKRPIYWLFDSGKKNGFKALIYMHRYNENTVPKVRLDYLHRVQNTYDKLLTDVNYKLTTELSVSDKKIAQNRQADLNAKLQEITAYDEKIAHIANQRISIDLDDGVTANYSKFADILAKIK